MKLVELQKTIQQVLTYILDLEADALLYDDLVEDLGMDESDVLHFLITLEDDLSAEIDIQDEDVLGNNITVNDLVNTISKYITIDEEVNTENEYILELEDRNMILEDLCSDYASEIERLQGFKELQAA